MISVRQHISLDTIREFRRTFGVWLLMTNSEHVTRGDFKMRLKTLVVPGLPALVSVSVINAEHRWPLLSNNQAQPTSAVREADPPLRRVERNIL